ncbi:MAG: hypothetical protein AAFZ02_13640, partial [Pseudomonadota bacterium]
GSPKPTEGRIRMSECIEAFEIVISKCADDCPCQDVHISLFDEGGSGIASITLSAHEAWKIGQGIKETADEAQAQKLRMAGRLA